jgi:oxygen-independent coproporphyrinogen-3 oxidase
MTLHVLTKPIPAYAPIPSEAAAALRSARGVDALYLHVPFCSSKCHYCDFYSLAGHMGEADQFLDALSVELDLSARLLTPDALPAPETIFIGGGTPTLLEPAQLDRLLTLLTSHIRTGRLLEFTVEANPNTFDPARAKVLAAHGVNRISFGAQSFIPSELRTLERDHDPESVPAAFDTARNAGITNLNLDLIFGIPGQTLDSLNHSLDRGLALQPNHISCYSLIYEPNTAMTARLKKGDFAPMDEELELAMFDLVHQRIRDAGLARYEVSNYALPGKECRHNIHYWKAGNWLAFGPSAAAHIGHSGVGNWRWKNVGSLAHYLDALAGPAPTLPWTAMEHLEPAAFAAEAATFWLRLAAGLNYGEFHARTGVHPRPALERILKKYADLDFIELTPTCARLAPPAIPISNRIFADVLDSFSP